MPAPRAALVGGFVLGGLALGVCAVLTLSSMTLFRKRDHVVVVFRDSVAGLSVGSVVTFRGVRIGQVKEMKIHINQADHSPVIPVFLELDRGNIVWTNPSGSGEDSSLQDAVKAGLRAQLTQQSLVTGIMTVNLDMDPKAPVAPIQFDGGVLVVPTIPSEIEMLKDQLLGLNLPEIASETRQALTSLKHTFDVLSAQFGPLSGKLTATLQNTDAALHAVQVGTTRTLADYDRLALVTQEQISVNGKEIAILLKTTEDAMTKANVVLASLGDMTGPRSATRNDLEAALRDLAASASSLREFTHDLERHPVGVLMRRASP
jgi:paraquat-inducible protein B